MARERQTEEAKLEDDSDETEWRQELSAFKKDVMTFAWGQKSEKYHTDKKPADVSGENIFPTFDQMFYHVDILQVWKDKESTYPHLSKLA